MKLKFALTLSLLLFQIVCTEKPGQSSRSSRFQGLLQYLSQSFNPKPMLKNLSENVIYNSYVQLQSKSKDLRDQINAVGDSCGGNNTNLTDLQEAWKAAFLATKDIEIIQFGPSTSYPSIDSWPSNFTSLPPDATSINTFISGSETILESTLSAKSDLMNGFGAMEFLLFDNGAGLTTSVAICNALSGRRKTFLNESSKLTYTRVTSLVSRWNPNISGNFSTTMQTANIENASFTTDQEVINKLVNQILKSLERIKDDKLGYASGLSNASGGVVKINSLEAKYSNISILAAQRTLTGLEKIYSGNGGDGFSAYVIYYSPSLNSKILTKISEIKTALSNITDLKNDILTNDKTRIQTAMTKITELNNLFASDLANASGTNTGAGPHGDGD